ncbi:MAG: hypothetical protein ABWZ27_02185, partial [Aestuariivirgaceae bacterium]
SHIDQDRALHQKFPILVLEENQRTVFPSRHIAGHLPAIGDQRFERLSVNFHSTPPPKLMPLALKLSLLWKMFSSQQSCRSLKRPRLA